MTLSDLAMRLMDALPVNESGPALISLVELANRLEFSDDEMRGHIQADRQQQLRRILAAMVSAIDAEERSPTRRPFEVLKGGR